MVRGGPVAAHKHGLPKKTPYNPGQQHPADQAIFGRKLQDIVVRILRTKLDKGMPELQMDPFPTPAANPKDRVVPNHFDRRTPQQRAMAQGCVVNHILVLWIMKGDLDIIACARNSKDQPGQQTDQNEPGSGEQV